MVTWPYYQYTREDLGKKVFYEYLMTGNKMFAIVKQKHKEIAVKGSQDKKERRMCKNCIS